MAVSHHPYLLLKMPGPNGVITVKGSFVRVPQVVRIFRDARRIPPILLLGLYDLLLFWVERHS
jgi:hypothetical protein